MKTKTYVELSRVEEVVKKFCGAFEAAAIQTTLRECPDWLRTFSANEAEAEAAPATASLELQHARMCTAMLHRDITGLVQALATINERARGAKWISEGRSPYEWDDAAYQRKIGHFIREIRDIATKALTANGQFVQTTLATRYKAEPVYPDAHGNAPSAPVQTLTASLFDMVLASAQKALTALGTGVLRDRPIIREGARSYEADDLSHLHRVVSMRGEYIASLERMLERFLVALAADVSVKMQTLCAEAQALLVNKAQ